MKTSDEAIQEYADLYFKEQSRNAIELVLRFQFPQIQNLIVEHDENGQLNIQFDDQPYSKEIIEDFLKKIQKKF